MQRSRIEARFQRLRSLDYLLWGDEVGDRLLNGILEGRVEGTETCGGLVIV